MKIYHILKLASEFYSNATPFDMSEFENIHDKDLKETLKDRNVIFYHGTSTKKLVKILQHKSLDPNISKDKALKSYKNSSYGVFVSKKYSGFTGVEMYARNAADQDNSDPVLLELVIPLSWVELDPDDTKYKEDGSMNDWGMAQGTVHRPISINRIKGVKFIGEGISKLLGSEGNAIFDINSTNWEPLGKVINLIKKELNKKKNKIDLPEEYIDISNTKRMSHSLANKELEEITAMKFQSLYDNFYTPGGLSPNGKSIYEETVLFLIKNKSIIYGPALPGLKILFDLIGHPGEYEEVLAPYPIKPGQSLYSYLKKYF